VAQLDREDLKRLARVGAIKRLEEIRREEAALRSAFPDLFRAGGLRAVAGGSRKRGRRRPTSAAEKKAVSERMKKYWAERRKASR
jgi:hypothetical protein